MTYHSRTQAPFRQPIGDVAHGLRFPAAGTHGAHRDDRPVRGQHRALWTEQHEIGAGAEGSRRRLGQFGIGNIAVGEHHPVYRFSPAQLGEP